jgi:hypothetical protein
MPPGPPPSRRFSFAASGQPQPQVFRPYAPPRLTSRSTNDAVIRASDPPRVRPRAVTATDVFKTFARSGLSFANAYGEYSQGVLEGLEESLKSAWSLVTHDMWQAKTWSELATTALALGLMQPMNIAGGLADAYAMDARWGTHVAQRQLDIMNAIAKLAADLPHWTPRQWGRAVGRLVGDILLAKGTGAAVKMAVTETMHLRTISGALQGLGKLPAGTSTLAKARAVIPVYGRFTSVRLQIPFRNVSTLANKSAFWSGLEGSSAEAKALAKASGRTSLEMTPGGIWLEEQTGLLGKQVDWFTQMRPQWARLSGRFARQARGSVEVFKGPKFDPVRSIWITEEKGALETSRRAGRVTDIIIRDVPKK